ncbi:CPLN1 protein, partial [Syrrhaptes paradoxus]|nr:CPLN1 protein [Syrrhaptes paradoxus]
HRRPTSKDIRLFQKKKEEKDKAMLSEHRRVRISQAVALVNEMLSDAAVFRENERRRLSGTRSPQEYRRRCMASTKGVHPVVSEGSRGASKCSFDQKVHRFPPALGLTQSRGKKRTF